MPRSVARADVVAVPSAFVADTVVDAFGIERDRIVVVPHGVDAPAADARADPAELRRRYGLGDRRVLVYPAITHPHKRHDFLVDLLAGPWADPDLVLVLLGGRGAADAALTEAVARAGVGNRVVRPGRVSGRRPRRADRAGRGAGVPLGVRGLRRAGARSDGPRHAGGVQRSRRPARSRRRRRGRAPADDRCVGRRPRRGGRRSRRSRRPGPAPRRDVHAGGVGPRPRRRLPAGRRRFWVAKSSAICTILLVEIFLLRGGGGCGSWWCVRTSGRTRRPPAP